MPTLADLLAAAQREKIAAQRRVSAAESKADRIIRRCKDEGRSTVTAEEEERIEALIAEKRDASDLVKEITVEIESLREEQRKEAETVRLQSQIHPTGTTLPGQRRAASDGPRWVRTDTFEPATVERGHHFADHVAVRGYAGQNEAREQAVIGQHGSLGHLVRAMTTTSGSAVVPTVWAGNIIDRARNLAAVLRAGAEIVPMNAKTVQVGRLTGDPTAAFRAEGSTITASDPTFDNVTLDAKTMSALVVGSLEWFQDASNVDEVVTQAIAQAFALQLDLAALYGSITSGAGSVNLPTPPNPRGVLGTLNAVASGNVLGGQTNGTTQTTGSFWNEIIDLIFTVRDANEEPTALIWNSKAARQYARAYDTTGQPLTMPPVVADLPRYVSNQVPSYTQGTMTGRATDVFAGDWGQLLIGQRLDMTIQTLTERYAENGQVGIVAHWRGDVQLARPRAFAAYRALQGA